MDRNRFIKSLAMLPFAATALNLSDLSKMAGALTATPKMPVLFLGHGSPMNAIEENEFVTGFRNIAKEIPRPAAILCVSAHWETRGTFVTAMAKPKTIHDFGGFPPELFAVQYPAPGNPEIAKEVAATVKKTTVGLDQSWGLDHGCWSVVKHLYPKADIPVLELSLDYTQPAQYHYDLARELAALRTKGVLIIGSGNMVHNLGMVAWDQLNTIGYGFDWALEARAKMNALILKGDFQPLINYTALGKSFQLAVPSPDHYLPLLYALALKDEKDEVRLFNDKPVAGALTMTSVKIG